MNDKLKNEIRQVLVVYTRSITNLRMAAKNLATEVAVIVGEPGPKELHLGSDLYIKKNSYPQSESDLATIWLKSPFGEERIGPTLPTTSARTIHEFVKKMALIDKHDSNICSPLRAQSPIRTSLDHALGRSNEVTATARNMKAIAIGVAKFLALPQLAADPKPKLPPDFVRTKSDPPLLLFYHGMTDSGQAVEEINNHELIKDFLVRVLVEDLL